MRMETIRAVGKLGEPAQATVRAVPLQSSPRVAGSYSATDDAFRQQHYTRPAVAEPVVDKWEALMEVNGVRFTLQVELEREFSDEENAEEVADQVVRDNLGVVSVRKLN
jgi:hypothetical protein